MKLYTNKMKIYDKIQKQKKSIFFSKKNEESNGASLETKMKMKTEPNEKHREEILPSPWKTTTENVNFFFEEEEIMEKNKQFF